MFPPDTFQLGKLRHRGWAHSLTSSEWQSRGPNPSGLSLLPTTRPGLGAPSAPPPPAAPEVTRPQNSWHLERSPSATPRSRGARAGPSHAMAGRRPRQGPGRPRYAEPQPPVCVVSRCASFPRAVRPAGLTHPPRPPRPPCDPAGQGWARLPRSPVDGHLVRLHFSLVSPNAGVNPRVHTPRRVRGRPSLPLCPRRGVGGCFHVLSGRANTTSRNLSDRHIPLT